MKKVERNILINTEVDKVFNYITTPTTQIDWMPSMVDVKDVSGSGIETSFNFKYKMAGVILDGECEYAEYIPNKRLVTKSQGGVESIFTFDFEPHNDGTMLKLTIEYNIPVPVLGKIGEAILLKRNEREADLAMSNIKAVLEG